MLAGKILVDFTSLFFPDDLKKNDIIFDENGHIDSQKLKNKKENKQ